MAVTTRLRLLRMRYGISLSELERAAGLCNQQLSRLELGILQRSRQREERAAEAMAALISARKLSLAALEQEYFTYQGRLLETMEVPPDEP